MDRIEQQFAEYQRRRELVRRNPLVQRDIARFVIMARTHQGLPVPQWMRDVADHPDGPPRTADATHPRTPH